MMGSIIRVGPACVRDGSILLVYVHIKVSYREFTRNVLPQSYNVSCLLEKNEVIITTSRYLEALFEHAII